MKKLFRVFVLLSILMTITSTPTPSKAQGLVEYALILVLVYGLPNDRLEAVYQLKHSGAVGPHLPNCSFTGTAEIEFIEVASGAHVDALSRDILLAGDLNSYQFESIDFPSGPFDTLAAVVRLTGVLPANCALVVNHFKSKFGFTTEVTPPRRLVPGTYTLTEVPPIYLDRLEPRLDGIIITLGESQVANLGLVARGRNSAPGLPPEDCLLYGSLIVQSLDNGGDPVEIAFEGDPLAFLFDITNALPSPSPGSVGLYRITVTNQGPSSAGSKPRCDDVEVTLGIADAATGETAATSWYIADSFSFPVEREFP